MAESDEEQLEALKKWWQRNGTALVLILVLGGGGWFGWQYWQDQRHQVATDSSMVYMAMLDAVAAWEQEPAQEKAARVASHAETLKQLNEDSQYAHHAAMTLARLSAAGQEYDNAAAELQWVLDNTDNEALAPLARLRLARLELARDRHDRALSLLADEPPSGFAVLFGELKGDIHAARGERERAREAYQAALQQLDPSDSQLRAMLELKINETLPAGETISEEKTS